MASKTSQKLKANKAAGLGSLIGYYPAGYPTLDDSVEAAVTMCQNGVDVLELGVPYSDPVMDGPVIQAATLVALENGFKLKQVFEAVKRITQQVDTPVLVMTYWNPVLSYGVEKFASDLAAAGGAGLITPDLIPDEAKEWLQASDEFELDRVFLAAPSSSSERVQTAVDLSRGFVYAVSTMGITGARKEVDQLAKQVVSSVRHASTEQNTAVGIGISTADQVLEVNQYADGAIVGSAFVRAYQDGGLEALKAKVQELSKPLRK
ncbi:tryptophan synthase subunit alpha [Rhodoluna sp.]|uniref:tryptophan synthase subunit alpha n=1 Tax=Rhodoluna sp. TaxID=1969481 RepID=UPI0025D3E01C|nr:tryptophan synthase subunit alpha [Rhodoluna sp.]